jgi:hypothetical protein
MAGVAIAIAKAAQRCALAGIGRRRSTRVQASPEPSNHRPSGDVSGSAARNRDVNFDHPSDRLASTIEIP